MPFNKNQCTVDGSNYTWWEQDGKHCSFPTGVTVTTHIDADAQSRPLLLVVRVCAPDVPSVI